MDAPRAGAIVAPALVNYYLGVGLGRFELPTS